MKLFSSESSQRLALSAAEIGADFAMDMDERFGGSDGSWVE
jgi:hypothetical protein